MVEWLVGLHNENHMAFVYCPKRARHDHDGELR